jgi:phage gp36-like protein
MYATLKTLLALQPKEVLLQLTDDDANGTFTARPRNAAYRNALSACEEASDIVDSYISGRYAVPLEKPYPDIIVQTAGQLALCLLYDRRRELDVPEGIKERRQRAMEWLKDVQSERASIPELRRPAPSAMLVSAPPREFGNALLGKI